MEIWHRRIKTANFSPNLSRFFIVKSYFYKFKKNYVYREQACAQQNQKGPESPPPGVYFFHENPPPRYVPQSPLHCIKKNLNFQSAILFNILGQVRLDQVRLGQVRSGQVKSVLGQVKSRLLIPFGRYFDNFFKLTFFSNMVMLGLPKADLT